MPEPITAVAGLGLVGAGVQANAASKAAKAQTQAADAGVAVQREQIAEGARQFDQVRAMLAPFVSTGTDAMRGQSALAGLLGSREQQTAIQGIEQSPQMQALMESGESAILQNAAATGGLRGGNTQAALAQFRPQLLSQLIEQQYGRLGGLSVMGQNAAAGVGSASAQQVAAGQAGANNITQLLQQQGAARAGSSLATGQAFGNVIGGIGGLIGQNYGTGFGGFGASGGGIVSRGVAGQGIW